MLVITPDLGYYTPLIEPSLFLIICSLRLDNSNTSFVHSHVTHASLGVLDYSTSCMQFHVVHVSVHHVRHIIGHNAQHNLSQINRCTHARHSFNESFNLFIIIIIAY